MNSNINQVQPQIPSLPLGIKEIERAIPHRYPFLFIDRVIEIELGKSIVAIKNLSFNEYFFQGHFPDRPIMPGVLTTEAMAQAAGVLTRLSFDPEYKMEALFFVGIDQVRFRRPIGPGDILRIQVELTKKRSTFFKYYGECQVDNETASSAEFILTSNI